jgi:N-acetylglutamate synthase-like GNAT family acetyltransferase
VTANTRFVHAPTPPAKPVASFLQRIELRDAQGQLIGAAAWHLNSVDEGVVQLVELTIDPKRRRQGHAGALLNETTAQARSVCRMKRVPLRRVWVALEQKTQVLARSFLTRHGFHHTSSVTDLLRDQDLLVYVRSFD